MLVNYRAKFIHYHRISNMNGDGTTWITCCPNLDHPHIVFYTTKQIKKTCMIESSDEHRFILFFTDKKFKKYKANATFHIWSTWKIRYLHLLNIVFDKYKGRIRNTLVLPLSCCSSNPRSSNIPFYKFPGTAVRALVWNNGTLLCKIEFNRNLSF